MIVSPYAVGVTVFFAAFILAFLLVWMFLAPILKGRWNVSDRHTPPFPKRNRRRDRSERVCWMLYSRTIRSILVFHPNPFAASIIIKVNALVCRIKPRFDKMSKFFPESSSLSSEEFARSIIKIHLILLKNRLTIIAKLFPTETSRNDNACRLQTAFGCSMSQPQMLEWIVYKHLNKIRSNAWIIFTQILE